MYLVETARNLSVVVNYEELDIEKLESRVTCQIFIDFNPNSITKKYKSAGYNRRLLRFPIFMRRDSKKMKMFFSRKKTLFIHLSS